MGVVPASALAELRQRGWCVLKLPPEAQRTVEVANDEAAAFFAQGEGYKVRFRRAAEEGGGEETDTGILKIRKINQIHDFCS